MTSISELAPLMRSIPSLLTCISTPGGSRIPVKALSRFFVAPERFALGRTVIIGYYYIRSRGNHDGKRSAPRIDPYNRLEIGGEATAFAKAAHKVKRDSPGNLGTASGPSSTRARL